MIFQNDKSYILFDDGVILGLSIHLNTTDPEAGNTDKKSISFIAVHSNFHFL